MYHIILWIQEKTIYNNGVALRKFASSRVIGFKPFLEKRRLMLRLIKLLLQGGINLNLK